MKKVFLIRSTINTVRTITEQDIYDEAIMRRVRKHFSDELEVSNSVYHLESFMACDDMSYTFHEATFMKESDIVVFVENSTPETKLLRNIFYDFHSVYKDKWELMILGDTPETDRVYFRKVAK